MAVIRWAGFAGENRALHPKFLPDSLGVLSRNQKPGRGDLRPWKTPLSVASVQAGAKTIYRMGRDVASDSTYWLSWPSVVHAVRGFDESDSTERTFYTGDGAPKVTDNTMGLASAPYPTTYRPMGLPAPSSAPLVATNSGSWTGATQTYFYVYTYVSDWGWESAPSPVSVQQSRPSDASATISGFASMPAGNFGLSAVRVYRTQTGSSGTEFFFLREIAVTGASVASASTTDDNRSLGEVLPTTTWMAPPSDLSFLTGMWNGMMAGISGNAVRFCEAYMPYAWPIAYDAVPPDSKPVGLGVVGQQLIVLTTGRPLVITGSNPDSMDQMPLEFSQACVSPRSIVSMGNGVAWASDDGLCWYGAGGPAVMTAGVMMREDWQALNPRSIVGKMYEGLYFGSYDDGSGRKGFVINPAEPRGIYFLDAGFEAMHFDQYQDQLYVLDGTSVERWDAGASFMTVRAKSKPFAFLGPTSLSVAVVVADAYPVNFKLHVDGALKFSKTVTSRQPFRLPGGFLGFDWQMEIDCAGAAQLVALAHSTSDLGQL